MMIPAYILWMIYSCSRKDFPNTLGLSSSPRNQSRLAAISGRTGKLGADSLMTGTPSRTVSRRKACRCHF